LRALYSKRLQQSFRALANNEREFLLGVRCWNSREALNSETTEGLWHTNQGYEEIHLPVGYVGLVRSVRAKDNNRQSTCGQEGE